MPSIPFPISPRRRLGWWPTLLLAAAALTGCSTAPALMPRADGQVCSSNGRGQPLRDTCVPAGAVLVAPPVSTAPASGQARLIVVRSHWRDARGLVALEAGARQTRLLPGSYASIDLAAGPTTVVATAGGLRSELSVRLAAGEQRILELDGAQVAGRQTLTFQPPDRAREAELLANLPRLTALATQAAAPSPQNSPEKAHVPATSAAR